MKVESIIVHKTLKRAQNENQQSADNCAGRSYPLTAMSFFINFMFFMVKKWFCTIVSKLSKMRKPAAREWKARKARQARKVKKKWLNRIQEAVQNERTGCPKLG